MTKISSDMLIKKGEKIKILEGGKINIERRKNLWIIEEKYTNYLYN